MGRRPSGSGRWALTYFCYGECLAIYPGALPLFFDSAEDPTLYADTCHPADSGRFDALREGTSGNWKPLP